MKLNAHHSLSTPKVLLVPYSTHHVPTYHGWMQDPSLQAATASDPLTLEEEYAMQRSWRTDHDKLTFTICLPLDQPVRGEDVNVVQGGKADAPERMIGDINLFLFPLEQDEDEGGEGRAESEPRVVGELELMIARKELQRRGYGRAALVTFMHYITSHWAAIATEYQGGSGEVLLKHAHASQSQLAGGIPQLAYLRVRIQESNVGSIHLFESVGFRRTAEKANYFAEVELRWREDMSGFLSRLDEEGVEAELLPYDEPVAGPQQ